MDNTVHLSEEDLSELDQLQNPDSQWTSKYAWDEEFQRHILSMMLNDREFLVQCDPLIEPGYFTNEVHQLTARLLKEHFNNRRVLPERFILTQEVQDNISRKPEKVQNHYHTELNAVYHYYKPGVDSRPVLRDKVTNFAKMQAMKQAFTKCLEMVKKDPENQAIWMGVYSILQHAMSIDYNFDSGLEYFLDFEARYKRAMEAKENGEVFTTGYESIDKGMLAGGPMRGELHAVMGMPGTGKSLMLVHAAVENIIRGRKVLYISTEMNEDKIAQRFDAQLLCNAYEDFSINNMFSHSEEIFDELEGLIKLNEWEDDKNRLVIKQFPAGMMDVAMMRSYHQQLVMRGFKPDIVIIDYVGEMKDHPKMPTHESRFLIIRDLRGFAVEEKVLCFTALQPNRSGREVQKVTEIDDDNLGDSYAQSRPLDGLWSINQTNDQKECGLGRVFIAKLRDGKSRYRFFVNYNYKTLKISEISFEEFKLRWQDYKHNKQEDVAANTMEGEASEIAKMEQALHKKGKKENTIE